jgi:outer membrane lipoprotein SlyB
MNCKRFFAALAIAGAVAASGCATMTPQERHLTGQIVGGATGAALGSLIGGGTGRLVAVGAGAVLGTIAGGKIANNMH